MCKPEAMQRVPFRLLLHVRNSWRKFISCFQCPPCCTWPLVHTLGSIRSRKRRTGHTDTRTSSQCIQRCARCRQASLLTTERAGDGGTPRAVHHDPQAFLGLKNAVLLARKHQLRHLVEGRRGRSTAAFQVRLHCRWCGGGVGDGQMCAAGESIAGVDSVLQRRHFSLALLALHTPQFLKLSLIYASCWMHWFRRWRHASLGGDQKASADDCSST